MKVNVIKQHKRKSSLTLISLLVISAILIFCFSSHANAKKKLVPAIVVNVAVVKQANVTASVSAIGSLIAPNKSTISPEVSGYIKAIYFHNGEVVSANQKLVQLDSAKTAAKVMSDKAALQATKLKYQQAQQLAAHHDISKQNLASFTPPLIESQALLKQDEATLNHETLRAPFAGKLSAKTISVGDYVAAGKPIVTLVDTQHLQVDYTVSENDLGKVKLGQRITIETNAFPGQTFYGTVNYIAPSIDPTSRTLALQAVVMNQSNKLIPGLFVKITQDMQKQQQAILIPEQSVNASFQRHFVYRIVGQKAIATTVTLGQRYKGYVVVLKGLQKNDKIVIAGKQKLHDGARIKIDKPNTKPNTKNQHA